MTRKFVSSGAHFCAVIATMNLVLMAAIANDESVGNRTSSVGAMASSAPGPRAMASASSLPSSAAAALQSPPIPSASSTTTTTTIATTMTAPPSTLYHHPVTPSIQSLVRSQSFEYNVNKNNLSVASPSPLIATKVAASHPNQLQNVNGSQHNFTMSSTWSSSSSGDPLVNSSTSPFVTLNSTVTRAQYKSNAMLPCNVRNSGDGVTVSWIRRKDYHLLTVGLQTYSSDDRFTAIHAQSPDDWTLKIRYVQPRDGGIYECQVSTHPPSSIFVTLLVVEARAEIVGGPEKFYKAGSSVELRCDLSGVEEPEFVFWYQGLRMINYDPSRHINVTHSKTSSMLVIHNVQKTDSGNYSCVPSNSHPAWIFVHIINGENPAAMQHGSHSTTCVPCPPLWVLSFVLSLVLQTLYLRFLSRNVDHNHHHHKHHRLHSRQHYHQTAEQAEEEEVQRKHYHNNNNSNLSHYNHQQQQQNNENRSSISDNNNKSTQRERNNQLSFSFSDAQQYATNHHNQHNTNSDVVAATLQQVDGSRCRHKCHTDILR